MRKKTCLLAASLLGAFTIVDLAPVASARTPTDSGRVRALALFDKSAASYAALKGVSMKYKFLDSQGGKITRGQGTIDFQKPGNARITAPTFPAPKKTTSVPSFKQAMIFVPAGASVPLYALLRGKNPLRESTFLGEKALWKEIRSLPGGGVAATAIDSSGVNNAPVRFTFWFDPKDHLLRRVDLRMNLKGKAFYNFTTLTDIQLNPKFAPDTFIVKPVPKEKEVTPAPW